MGTFGHRVFDSLEEKFVDKTNANENIDTEPLLYLKTSKVEAKGRRTNEGFVVYKGAIVSTNPTKSCPETVMNLRAKYNDRLNEQVLIEDILFTSPSAASSFIRFANTNGLDEWKDTHGQSLKYIESIED